MRFWSSEAGLPRWSIAVLISLFASFTTSFLQINAHVLYKDLSTVYPFFYDNFHSLNYFGTFSWWMPDAGIGYPAYYYSAIGPVNIKSPVFMIFGAFAFLCGRADLYLDNISAFYIVYMGFALPLLLTMSCFWLASLLFRDKYVIYFITILSAFSPTVICNLGDPGHIEPLAMNVAWAAACIAFVRAPNLKTFTIVGLVSGVLLLGLGYGFVTTGPVFFPLLLVCSLIPFRRAKRVLAAMREIPLAGWLALAVLCVVCALPAAVTLPDGRDFLSLRTSGMAYPFVELKTGNPLEPLTASAPDILFNWNAYTSDPRGSGSNQFLPIRTHHGDSGYTYLGIPVLALAVLGLLFGRQVFRTQLMVFALGAFLVGLLSGFSPLFSMLLQLNSPLRAYNHFSDLLYRGGGCIILIFAAGLGLEVLSKRRRQLGPTFLGLFGGTVVFGLALYFYIYPNEPIALGSPLGTYLATALFTAVAFVHLCRSQSRSSWRRASVLVLVVLTLDVSNAAYWFVRSRVTVNESLSGLDSGGRHKLRIVSDHPVFTFVAERLVQYRGAAEVAAALVSSVAARDESVTPDAVPASAAAAEDRRRKLLSSIYEEIGQLRQFGRVQLKNEVSSATIDDDWREAFEKAEADRNLAVFAADQAGWRRVAEQKPSATTTERDLPEGKLTLTMRTYERLKFRGFGDAPGAVLIRMPWHRFWKATVNGEYAPVGRALAGFVAVPVPAGPFVVSMRFDPTLLRISLYGAYAGIIIWLIGAIVIARRSRMRPSYAKAVA